MFLIKCRYNSLKTKKLPNNLVKTENTRIFAPANGVVMYQLSYGIYF